MKIELMSLEVKNFKGLKSFDLVLNGEDVCVYAENGVGKTTLKDAFRWCLSGKDSNGDTDFGLRPVDGKNNPIKGLVTSAELCIATDGTEHVYLREHHEKVAKDQSRSYTTKCWIDEVSMPIGRYKASVAELLPDETYKLLTDPGHFFDEAKFHWTKRREVLTLLPGEISSPTGFEDLLKEINGRGIADYKKILRDRISGYTAERDEINPRLDECQLKLKDYAENGHDDATLMANRHEISNDLAALDIKRGVLVEDQTARQSKIDNLNTLKDTLAAQERALKNDTSHIQHLVDEKATIATGVAGKREIITNIENNIKLQESTIITDKAVLESHMHSLSKAREHFAAVKANLPVKRELTEFDKTCPHCKQDLPKELKAELINTIESDHATAMANYKTKLQEASVSGIKLNTQTAQDQKIIEAHEAGLIDLKEQLGKAGIEWDEAEAYRVKRFAEIAEQVKENPTKSPADDVICVKLNEKIKEASGDIGAPVTEQLETIETSRSQFAEQVKNLNDLLRQADTAKEIQPRINQLKDSENDLAQEIADTEKEMDEVKAYEKAECTIIEDAVNGMFQYVKFRLFKEQLKTNEKGEIQTVLCCDALLNGVPYRDMSDGQKIFAEIDVFNVLSEHYNVDIPLFVDHAEALTLAVETDSQVIMLEAKTNDYELDDPDFNKNLPKDYYSQLRVVVL